jgi:ATP-dependent protease ClpP protease subunit
MRPASSVLLGTTLSALLALSPSMASATDVLGFRIGTACDGMGEACGRRIFAEGPIDEGAPKRFASFFALNAHLLPHQKQVSLHSPGGNVLAAIQLGTLIRQLGLDTELVEGQICASACALVFMGGIQRSFWNDSRLGVHQFYSGGIINEGGAQELSTAISTYATTMGIDRRVIDIASFVPPQSMHWLTPNELKQLRVDNSDAFLSDWTIDTDLVGNLFASSVLRLPGDRVTATYSLLLHEGRPHLQVSVDALPSEHQRFRQAFSGPNMPLSLTFDSPHLDPIDLEPLVWARRPNGVTGLAPLPDAVVDSASKSTVIQVYFPELVGRAVSDMDVSVRFDSQRFASVARPFFLLSTAAANHP